MHVQEMAQAVNISPDTVRYYTRIGLLHPRKNPKNGYNEYGLVDHKRLKFITNARQLGFSIQDIAAILEESDRGQAPCSQVRNLVEKRMIEIKQELENTQTLYSRMKTALKTWQNMPDKQPGDASICPLIEHWSESTAHETTK